MRPALITIALIGVTMAKQLALGQDFPIDPDTKLITYSEVIEVPGASQAELHSRATTWASRYFRSAKTVIDVEDKAAGKLIAKGQLPVSIKVPITGRTDAGVIISNITILSKDGKYKYTVDNLTHERPQGAYSEKWVSVGPLEKEKPKTGLMARPSGAEWRWVREAAEKELLAMVDNLKKGMAKAESDF